MENNLCRISCSFKGYIGFLAPVSDRSSEMLLDRGGRLEIYISAVHFRNVRGSNPAPHAEHLLKEDARHLNLPVKVIYHPRVYLPNLSEPKLRR